MTKPIRKNEAKAAELAAKMMDAPATSPTPAKTEPLKIAIVGTAPSSDKLAPYDDESWQIWGLSTAPEKVKRWDCWCEIHDLKRKAAVYPQYIEQLTKVEGKTIWLHEADPRIPCSVTFPRERIVDRFGPLFTNTPPDHGYFTNTVSWLMALAALMIEDNGMNGEVGVWGVDMAVGDSLGPGKSEYRHQRPSCEWFLGYLTAFLGKPVTLPVQSDLCTCRDMYGFDTDNNPMYFQTQARRLEQQQRKHEAQARLRENQVMLNRFEGGIIESDHWLSKMNGEAARVPMEQRKADLQREHAQCAAGLDDLKTLAAAMDGALSEGQWFDQGGPA